MTSDEIAAIIAERTMGHDGPLSYACFTAWCNDCGLWGCQCRCHYVSAAQLRRIMAADLRLGPLSEAGGL
jgi:hypothetical protein